MGVRGKQEPSDVDLDSKVCFESRAGMAYDMLASAK